jgi:tagatose-1,6-bisphosphate aldolase
MSTETQSVLSFWTPKELPCEVEFVPEIVPDEVYGGDHIKFLVYYNEDKFNRVRRQYVLWQNSRSSCDKEEISWGKRKRG